MEVKESKEKEAQSREALALIFNVLDLLGVLGLDKFNLDLNF
jgi:hypothetical protein